LAYYITYNGNGSTGGTAPIDSTAYNYGDNPIVMDKSTLIKTDYIFVFWNTSPDGNGNSFFPGDQYSYITSDVTLYAIWQTNYIGGLIGVSIPDTTVFNSYWNTETSGQLYSSGGEGKTTAQMQTKSTYVNWDFTSLWQLRDSTV
jgi:hypothetical protein